MTSFITAPPDLAPPQPIRQSLRDLLASVLLVAALALASSLLVPPKAHAQDQTELRIGYQKSAGPQLLEGLNLGSVDVGYVGEAPPIFAQAAGAKFAYIGYDPAAPEAEAILVPKDSAIKSVADLKGRRVALNKGSNVHYLLAIAVRDAAYKAAP